MSFVLVSLNFYILLFLHAKIYGYQLTIKRFLGLLLFYFLLEFLLIILIKMLYIPVVITVLDYPIFFITYTFFLDKHKYSITSPLFYALFPITFWSIIYDFFVDFIIPNFASLTDIYAYYDATIFSILAGLLSLLIIKVFQYDFSYLRSKVLDKNLDRIMRIANTAMLGYFILVPFIGYIKNSLNLSINHYQGAITAIYFFLFIYFVNILDRNVREELQKDLVLQKEIQLQNLTSYSKQVEGLYQEVRSFRHDYANILTSLKIGIDRKDINLVAQIYDRVLKESGKSLQDTKFDVVRLRNIEDLSLKSLLISKLSEAQSLLVPVSLEIEKPIAIKKIEEIDFLTVVSILLDNAIEAAVSTTVEEPLSVCFFEDIRSNKQVLIIQNPTLDREIDVTKIFERGMSSKGQNRGVGLSNVNSILTKYPNIILKTTSSNFIFKQVLEIEV